MKRRRNNTSDIADLYDLDCKQYKSTVSTNNSSPTFETQSASGSVRPVKKFHVSSLQTDTLEVPKKKLLFFTSKNTDIYSLPSLRPIKTLKNICLAYPKNFMDQYVAGLNNSTRGISLTVVDLTTLKVKAIFPEKYMPSQNLTPSIKHFDCYIQNSTKFVVYNMPDEYIRIHDLTTGKEHHTFLASESGIRKMKVHQKTGRIFVITNEEFPVMLAINIFDGKILYKYRLEDNFPIRDSFFLKNGSAVINLTFRCLEIIPLSNHGKFERRRVFFKETTNLVGDFIQSGSVGEFNRPDYQVMFSPSLARELMLFDSTANKMVKISMKEVASKLWQAYLLMERPGCVLCLPLMVPNSNYKTASYCKVVI